MILEMTATFALAYGTASRSAGPVAQFVADQVEQGRRHMQQSYLFGMEGKGVFDELLSVGQECAQPNWDGYGADPVLAETVGQAWAFVKALPLGFPRPSVGAEADGHLTLEWYRNPHRVLSVSISPDKMLYYAAMLGSSKRSGTEPFYGEAPEDILQIIGRVHGA